METDKYFPNLGSEVAACAEAFGEHEICSPYSCRPPFSAPPSGLLHWAPLRIFRRAKTDPCDYSSL
jgi:hypothetical protein